MTAIFSKRKLVKQTKTHKDQSIPMSTDSIQLTKKNPQMFNVSKPPSNISSRRSMISLNNWKPDLKYPLSSLSSNQEDLENIVDNLSTIVKRSEKSLIATKSGVQVNTVRRTSSLHLTNRDLSSNFHQEKLIDKNNELSRSRESIAPIPPRRSLRNVEKFSGIKCSLPSNTSTIPKSCKTFDKHSTPTKIKPVGSLSSIESHPVTPIAQKGQTKSPWRLRFEKFINHQELTPLSPVDQSVALHADKNSTMNKENRTPSFRLPGRRMSKIHTLNK